METRANSPGLERVTGGWSLPWSARGRKRPAIRHVAIATLLACLAFGDRAAARPSRATDMTGGPLPTPSAGGTLTIIQERASTLDPKEIADVYSGLVSLQIHRGLLIYNANLTPVPDLARSWTISRDGLRYAMELNRGVRFHNGRELTSDDVVFSFERIFRPGTNPGIAGQFLGGIVGVAEFAAGRAPGIAGITPLSRYSVEIRLARPEASFLWALAMNQTAIVPREVVESKGDAAFGQEPVGCGPYRLVTNQPNRVVLAANRNYYRKRAWVDTLVFVSPENHTTSEGTTALIDGLCDLAEVPGYRREEIDRHRRIRLISRRELTLSFIGMNVTRPPFDNVHVRRAMALSVDREAVMKANPSGQIPATGILPPGIAGYSPEVRVYPCNLDRARRELEAAGYPNGVGLPEILYFTNRTTSRAYLADSVLIAGWRRIGIPVKRVPTDWVELNRLLDNYELPLFSLSWVADIPDPDSFVGSLFASDSPSNFSRYSDARIDSLLREARTTVDMRTRQGLYGRIETGILQDAPVIPLYTSTTAYGIRKNVHGLELTPLGISSVDLAHVWIGPAEHGTGTRRGAP
jgi:oligopeptide transport system substrate-binding protein